MPKAPRVNLARLLSATALLFAASRCRPTSSPADVAWSPNGRIAAMTHDQQTVLTAYDAAIAKLYATLFDAYVSSAGNTAQQQQALQRFMTGVAAAKASRDNAVEKLG